MSLKLGDTLGRVVTFQIFICMAAPYEIGLMLGSVAESPKEKFEMLGQLGVHSCQILLHQSMLQNGLEKKLAEFTLKQGIEITTIFCGFDGESYQDLPTIQTTIGLVPESLRKSRVAEMKEIAKVAHRLGVPAIALHIGCLPSDRKSANYRDIVQSTQEVVDFVASLGMKLTLETGQETANHLKEFIQDVGRPNLAVNFDPANMLIYGNDKPLPALDVLAPHLFNVHAKDGVWPKQSAQLGEEVPIGKGQVNFPEFIRKLKSIGYRGPIIIEREISGPQQLADMRESIKFLKSLIES
jgi:sugar phosphate isomerase/epimerase